MYSRKHVSEVSSSSLAAEAIATVQRNLLEATLDTAQCLGLE